MLGCALERPEQRGMEGTLALFQELWRVFVFEHLDIFAGHFNTKHPSWLNFLFRWFLHSEGNHAHYHMIASIILHPQLI